jgi:hypothetical protein
VNDTLEHTARRIAEQGRDALLERLRPAFAEAASAHADLLEIDDEQLEKMVQRAADRADGMQWRRALAGVATKELGIGLGEALSHPAVTRAQAIVGAPAYEESLRDLDQRVGGAAEERVGAAEGSVVASTSESEVASTSDGTAPKASEAEATPDSAERPVAEADEPAVEAPEAEEPEAEEPEAEEPETETPRPVAAEPRARPPAPEAEKAEQGVLRVAAIHLGGVANLAASEEDLELRFSDNGLEIVRQADDAALARMRWPEISAVDVPVLRRRLLRRGPAGARLIIHSAWGEANFEIPGLTPDELHDELAPIVAQQH